MDRNKLIKVVNRGTGPVGYHVPEMGVRRQFQPREEKSIAFEELERLSYLPGGSKLMEKYLVIRDLEALKILQPNTEPEYFYDIKDIHRILTTASYEEFLDCLDFAPDGVIDILQEMAVEMEINDLNKRKALKKRTGLDITKAIEIKNTKYDGDSEANPIDTPEVKKRRVQVGENTAAVDPTSPRRTAPQAGSFVIPD